MTKSDPRRFSHESFDKIIAQTIEQIRNLAALKGGEYAGDEDRLANFRRNAQSLGLDYRQIWAVYSAKHWDALIQYIKDVGQGTERRRLESLEGRCDDLIVYLLLFKAMLKEQEAGSKGNDRLVLRTASGALGTHESELVRGLSSIPLNDIV